MTPELKSFLTDLLAVLEKHDAEIVPTDIVRIFMHDNMIMCDAARFEFLGAREIKQALEHE